MAVKLKGTTKKSAAAYAAAAILGGALAFWPVKTQIVQEEYLIERILPYDRNMKSVNLLVSRYWNGVQFRGILSYPNSDSAPFSNAPKREPRPPRSVTYVLKEGDKLVLESATSKSPMSILGESFGFPMPLFEA